MAVKIGMENTNFSNSSGINSPDNLSTVRDIMLMSKHLIKNYPNFYKYFKEKKFTWDRTGGDPITQGNRNPLLYKNLGADGIKTGYLSYEKYSLASSIDRNGRRLIAVGSGFNSKNARSRESTKLLTYGLTNFDLVHIAKANDPFYLFIVFSYCANGYTKRPRLAKLWERVRKCHSDKFNKIIPTRTRD